MAIQKMHDIFIGYHLYNNDKNDPKSSYKKALELKNGLESMGYECFLYESGSSEQSYDETVVKVENSTCFLFVINEGIKEKCKDLGIDGYSGQTKYRLLDVRCTSEIDVFIRNYGNAREARNWALCFCDCPQDKLSDRQIGLLHRDVIFDCITPARENGDVYKWAKKKLGKRKVKENKTQEQGADGKKSYSITSLVDGLKDFDLRFAYEDFIAIKKYKSKNNKVVIPNCVTCIDDYAFYMCRNLESIEIPNSVISIGKGAFKGCVSLESIDISKSITKISDQTFYECKSLENIKIPKGVEEISGHAFCGCSSLKNIVIPNSVIRMGNYIFSGCSSLEKIEISKNLDKIDDYVFSECSSLEKIEIPNCITSIGEGVFSECSSLENVEIPNSVDSIGDGAFFGCSSLISIKIFGRIKKINNDTFANCRSLEIIEIPNSVKSIGNGAFFDCISLKNIEILSSITCIESMAFYRSGLVSVVISKSVASIGDDAFFGCDDLTIYCEVESKPKGWSESWNSSNRPVVWGYKGK